ncbi:N-acetylneuraminate lyase isoform X3 [Malaclemys terrapin pileata]|uniref:N-acetylneuraminate lyase isoform X3 n=1 Tax=Malaclemys terrapin pileata TaxID=2991368 RepID=UPI0023A851FB|nr:N-acetylneuraminate lyase isoform X3 [Malaclemys terrapin pileata]
MSEAPPTSVIPHSLASQLVRGQGCELWAGIQALLETSRCCSTVWGRSWTWWAEAPGEGLNGIPKEIAGSHSSYNHSNDSRWAKHAAAIGASGIAGIAPFFFKPTNKDTLVAFLREVASEAPGIPFYYYHIPPLTGVKIRVEELLDGIKEQIPTFQGVKFSDTDLLDFAQCVKNNKEQFVLLYGVDEHLLSALAIGASGAVGSTYNYLGKKNNLMLEAFAKQDLALAQRYQFCTGEFLSFVFKLGRCCNIFLPHCVVKQELKIHELH